MPQWATFAGITGVVLVLLLVLTRLTQSAFTDGTDDGSPAGVPSEPDEAPGVTSPESDEAPGVASPESSEASAGVSPESGETAGDDRRSAASDTIDPTAASSPPTESSASPGDRSVREQERVDRTVSSDRSAAGGEPIGEADRIGSHRPPRSGERRAGGQVDPESLSTGMVLANVAATQGLFAIVLLGAVIYTGIPADALGVEFSRSYLETGLLWGTAFGFGLYIANEVGAAAATRFGFDHDEGLRELLAPETAQGWLILLVGVLPIIAVFEELLFRAALVGALSAGFGIDPWLLAIGSSIAFALGHGIQGPVGVVVTGLLGFVLAAAFIVTGSVLVVVVAHYWINALEFVVHEGVGFDWAETIED